MLVNRINKAADVSNPNSLSNNFRQRRFNNDFVPLLDHTLARNGTGLPLEVLDIGGTPDYWVKMGMADDPRLEVTTVNLEEPSETHPNINALQGDATELPFPDKSFDIVFSNSTIEHVGDQEAQQAMAGEVLRLAGAHYVQTPCLTFPMEPHLRSLLCHPLLPRAFRARELQRVRSIDREEAEAALNGIRLLRKSELQAMLPDSTIRAERLLWVKSWTAIQEQA